MLRLSIQYSDYTRNDSNFRIRSQPFLFFLSPFLFYFILFYSNLHISYPQNSNRNWFKSFSTDPSVKDDQLVDISFNILPAANVKK